MKKLIAGFITLILIGLVTKAQAAPLSPALQELLKKDPIALLWTGTGFFITSDGYALTNCHVMCKAGVNYTALFNGTIHKVKIVRPLKDLDVALVKVELKKGESVTPLALSVRKAQAGEHVTLMGYPLTESVVDPITISFGEVTRIATLGRFVIDASAFPGNSGSPVIDDNGGVIGILFAIKEDFGSQLMLGSNLVIPSTLIASQLTDINYSLNKGYSFGYTKALQPSLADQAASVFMIQAWGHVSVVLNDVGGE